MATENFKEAGEIFQNAIEIDDQAEREQYMENACKGDPKLRAEVEALLSAHDKAGDYLESPAVRPAASALPGLALRCRTRQHPVLGRHPTLSFVLKKFRNH